MKSQRIVAVTALLAGATVLLVLDLQWLGTYRYPIASPDFFVYYLAASVGRSQGWAAMYDPSIFLPLERTFLSRPLPYLNPPELAWLVLPLSWMPYAVAAWIWRGLLVCAGAVVCAVATPGRGLSRAAAAVSASVLLPVFISVVFGQVSILIVAAVALAWWLIRRDHPWVAGLVLSFIIVKPQLAFMVPIALLLGGYWRTFLSWLAATALLSAAALLAVGTSVFSQLAQSMEVIAKVPGPIQMSLERQLPMPIALVAIGIVLAAGTVMILRSRVGGPSMPIAIGLVASILVSPYINFYDLCAVVLAGWLVLRSNATPWQRLSTFALYPLLYLAPILPLLSLLGLCTWLVCMPIAQELERQPAAGGQATQAGAEAA